MESCRIFTRKVASSTQRQALNAIVFLYREVLGKPLDGKIAHIRAKKKPKTVTVLGKEEVSRFFRYMNGTHALMAKLLYGSWLRLMECVRLRIKDIDFDRKRREGVKSHFDLFAISMSYFIPLYPFTQLIYKSFCPRRGILNFLWIKKALFARPLSRVIDSRRLRCRESRR